MFLKALFANSLRDNVRMLVFRPEVLNPQVSRPQQLTQKMAPYIDVLNVGWAQRVLGQVCRPFVVLKHSNNRRPQTLSLIHI